MKNVQIRLKETTITIKDYILNNFSEEIFKGSYEENKKEVNKFVRLFIDKNSTDTKYLSQEMSKNLTNIVIDKQKEKIKSLEEIINRMKEGGNTIK